MARFSTGIPTVFAGRQMDSRLEARQAAWFVRHGIEWQYEPDCFDLSTESGPCRYTPDWFLPRIRCYVETKGLMLARDRMRLGRFVRVTQELGCLLLISEHPAGQKLSLVRPGTPDEPVFDEVSLVMAKCDGCALWYFADGQQERWSCPHCGAFRADGSHVSAIHPSGGQRQMRGTHCSECGAIEDVLVARDWSRW